MAEYIDKQAALANLNETYDNMAGFHPQFYNGYQFAVNLIRNFLKADVAEVRHGRWIRVDDTKCKCSECGAVAFIAQYPPSADKNYCPNCGAKMDGGARVWREEMEVMTMANDRRLIDANQIAYHKSGFPGKDGQNSRLDWAFRDDIEKLPTIDAVEVVRCKDCKYMTPVEGGLPLCCQHNTACAYDDFCSYGERRCEE